MLQYTLNVHEDAIADIEALCDVDLEAGAAIAAWLEQAEVDQWLLESLTIRDFGADESEDFHVDKWIAQHRAGRNLWRVKIWKLEKRKLNYRIIYALDSRQTKYYVLGVLHRKFDYDPAHERSKRLLAAYDDLGIPKY